MSHVQPPLPFPDFPFTYSEEALAQIIEAEPNGNAGAVIVTVLCPFCSQRHSHGVPATDERDFTDAWGGRIAHCTTERGQYVLHDPHNLVYPARWLGKQGGRA